MPTIEPTATNPTFIPHSHEVLAPETPNPLSPPEFAGGTPEDALTEMLLALERQNQSSLELNLSEIKAARERIADLQRQLADELARAIEAARRPRKKKGWFSRTFGKVVDVIAKVVAKQTEAMKDVVMLHADLAMSMKHFGDHEALFQSIKTALLELNESSETERAVEGFAQGTIKFAGDVATFQFVLVAALAENAAEGDALHAAAREALRDQAERLWHSAETNILENPDFWTVTARLAQGVAVASAVASGGSLAPAVAVLLILALEADNRYDYLKDVVGKEAAPWVRLGMHIAAAASTGASSNDVLEWMQVGLLAIRGAGDVHQGVRTWQEGQRQGDEVDRRADMQETLYQIQAVQRLMDALIELYEEKSEHRTSTAEASVALVEARAKIEAALVLQG